AWTVARGGVVEWIAARDHPEPDDTSAASLDNIVSGQLKETQAALGPPHPNTTHPMYLTHPEKGVPGFGQGGQEGH
ncbi:hypothetical protein FRC12_023443, partial [Ceratobasidium sp. 428]